MPERNDAGTSIDASPAVDLDGPELAVAFPPPSSLTNERAVTVRGSTSDESNVAAVRINDELAISEDGYANWSLRVALAPGVNALSVIAEDEHGNGSIPATLTIESRSRLSSLVGIVLDSDRNRVIAASRPSGTLIEISLASGVRSVFSENATQGSDVALAEVSGIAIDRTNARLYVTDGLSRSVVRVDLESGARTLLSNNQTPASAVEFVSPSSVAYDPTRNLVLVLEKSLNALIAVDTATGARTLLSSNEVPNTDTPFSSPRSVAFDPGNDRLLVAGSTGLIGIDPVSGTRALVSPEPSTTGTRFFFPSGITVDEPSNRAFVAARVFGGSNSQVIEVDLADGARAIAVSGEASSDVGLPLGSPASLAMVGDELWITSNEYDLLFRADLSAGEHLVANDSRFPSDAHPFGLVTDIEPLDETHVLVMDTLNQQVGLSRLNTLTGERTPVAGRGVPGDLPLPSGDIDFDPTAGRVFISSSPPIAVDLALGEREEIGVGDGGVAIVADLDRERLLVLEREDLFAIDLSSGNRRLFSPRRDQPFEIALDLALDAAATKLYLLTSMGVFRVDLDSGSRTAIVENTGPGPGVVLDGVTGVALDEVGGRLLVIERTNRAVMSIDLATGGVIRLANAARPNRDNPMISPRHVAVDSSGRLLVTDDGRRAILALDSQTGERVILSQAIDAK